jgi:hypothetical protein
MIIRDGLTRLKTRTTEKLYGIEIWWVSEHGDGWSFEDGFSLDERQALRLMEDIRTWLKARRAKEV